MNASVDPKVADLVAALPEGIQDTVNSESELQDLLASLANKRVPTNRVLRMWSLGTLQAKVVLVDKMIDPASNTFRVRAELPNAKSAIPPGLRCRAKLHSSGKQIRAVPAPTVPNEDPVKVRPASFKLDSKLTVTNKSTSTNNSKIPGKLAKTVVPAKTSKPANTSKPERSEPTTAKKRSSAQISSH